MGTPFFSIVVPAYNTAAYLSRCIGSLLEQSFGDFEIFLINDGSTDDTASLVDSFQAKDQRIHGLHIPHSGVSAARNSGLRLAQGEYVLFVDSDDALVVPDALERMHRNLTERPEMLSYGILTCNAEKLDIPEPFNHEETGGRYKSISETADDCIRRNVGFISACTHAYRLPVIRAHHICFQEGLVFGEDRLFNWNYLRYCKRLFYMKDRIYIYTCDRKNSGSHRFVAGLPQILMRQQEENAATMLALCSGGVSEEEKERFRARCFLSAAREAWEHLLLYYPSLTTDQRSEELRGFLDLPFPDHLCMAGEGGKRRLWISGLRLAAVLRAMWFLKLLLHAESIFFRRKKK